MRIVIIGGGPCGLGAAFRCEELIRGNSTSSNNLEWTLVEQSSHAGGLASSIVDEQGFTWDIGGHVIFSHYAYFSRLLDHLLPREEWNHRCREAWIWMRDNFIPYPLQLNIHRLPVDEALACVEGLLLNERSRHTFLKPTNFQEWLLQNFGRGLCESFMFPYNRKVWAFGPEQMNVEWMGERVATVNTLKVVRNLVTRQDDIGWGPNSTFRFPLHGGTGAIWSALHKALPQHRFRFDSQVTRIDGSAKVVHLANGDTLPYDALISTMPMDKLCSLIQGTSLSPETLAEKATQFKHSSTHVIGFGLAGSPPEHLRTKCWLYFPEDDCPFYRCTVFSNYSSYVVPKPGEQWSIMCEVAESPEKPVDAENIISIAEQGLYNTKLVSKQDDTIVSRFHVRLEYGYPTPFTGRDALFDGLNAEFEKLAVFSRGRFGSWKYEVSNQDHSLMLGVEAVDRILFGTEEMTLNYPGIVNSKNDKAGRVPQWWGGCNEGAN